MLCHPHYAVGSNDSCKSQGLCTVGTDNQWSHSVTEATCNLTLNLYNVLCRQQNLVYALASQFVSPVFIKCSPNVLQTLDSCKTAAETVFSRLHESKVKVKVKKTMDRYTSRGDNDGESASFIWPTKAANPTYVTREIIR